MFLSQAAISNSAPLVLPLPSVSLCTPPPRFSNLFDLRRLVWFKHTSLPLFRSALAEIDHSTPKYAISAAFTNKDVLNVSKLPMIRDSGSWSALTARQRNSDACGLTSLPIHPYSRVYAPIQSTRGLRFCDSEPARGRQAEISAVAVKFQGPVVLSFPPLLVHLPKLDPHFVKFAQLYDIVFARKSATLRFIDDVERSYGASLTRNFRVSQSSGFGAVLGSIMEAVMETVLKNVLIIIV
ncbi:hypothetical protein B0H13DRAFT_1905733 [Mycena leptocephala]|nr:hypothetical protein B0H13DRAFT_1905733 [Mycena leptocephala]